MKYFVVYFWFCGWDCLSLGIHVSVSQPNVEIHVPFGFVRIGWEKYDRAPRWQRLRFNQLGKAWGRVG